MATVTINDLAPHLDGTYQLDLNFSFRDYRDIKKITGIRAGEVFESLEAGDLDIYVAMASIALRRAGVAHDPDVLFDATPPTGIAIDFSDGEVEVVDDPTTSANGTQTSTSEGASGNDSKDDTTISQETSPQSGSGIQQQDSTSVPAT